MVAGGDDAGTVAAGTQLAARLPRLWNMSGMTLGGIEQQIPAYLAKHGVAGSAARVVALVVDAERRGIASVRVRASVAPAQASRALAVLADLDAAHRRGQEERTLNFAEAAVTIVEVVAAGRTQGEASVRRSGLNARTLTPPVDPDEYAPEPNAAGIVEPRLAPAKPFDLATAYSIEGWYGDAYQDLIPDRTDTSIIIGDASDAIGAAHIAARLGLETTGMNLPITRRDDKVKEPGAEASPILVGRSEHAGPATREDREDPPRRPATGPGRSPHRAARVRQRHRDRRRRGGRGRHAARPAATWRDGLRTCGTSRAAA